MVEVVSDGPTGSKKATCRKCTYRLKYTGVDVKSRNYMSMGERDIDYYIECPQCGNKNSVKKWHC